MAMNKELMNELFKLKNSEKLILVEALWDSIASDPSIVELPEHHKVIIEERLKTLDEDTEKGESWDKFRKIYIYR